MDVAVEKIPPERIFEILRDRICLLEYPPGHRLRETTLADEFGVSRTPIRAVLQKLAHGGLIESKDGVGTLVTTPTVKEIGDVYRMRLEIAELIGRMSPNVITEQHITTTDTLLMRAKKLQELFDLKEYWTINHDLHFLIASIIGNLSLRQMWDHLYFQAARMWYQHAHKDSDNVAEQLIAELENVRLALVENDAVALGYIQRNFIAYGLKKLEAAAMA